MGEGQLSKTMSHSTQMCMLQVCPATTTPPDFDLIQCNQSETQIEEPRLQPLLDQFQDIFKEPTTLPPSRGIYDHRIPLKADANLANIRPYRYPLKQKDIIEKLIEEMLTNGIIQPS